MACERNRIIELREYLSSLGITVNIGKNKARGHKGIFMHRSDLCRIDVAEDVKEENILSVMLHEFAHYIHYNYDKKLLSLDFIFGEMTDELREELIKITVNEVPKEFAFALYAKKEELNGEIKNLVRRIKVYYPDFKLSQKNKKIEKEINGAIKYLLKYDRVNFFGKLYSIDKISEYDLKEEVKLYLLISSKQRAVKRINSRINRLNKYYNNLSELFARFLDSYYTKTDYTKDIAPTACSFIEKSNSPYIENLNKILV